MSADNFFKLVLDEEDIVGMNNPLPLIHRERHQVFGVVAVSGEETRINVEFPFGNGVLPIGNLPPAQHGADLIAVASE
jgi:hypothetical protein